MLCPQRLISFQKRNRCRGSGRDGGWQRGGENKARRIRADRITHLTARGYIAPHNAKGFGQRAVDDVDLWP